MDEENTVQAENTQAVEDNSQDTSPVDETTTSESTDQQPDTDGQSSSAEESGDETQGSQSEDTERKPSRAERRIRDLSEKLKQAKSQLNSQPTFQGQQPPQRMFEDGQEYTAQDLEQRMVQAANNIASLQTQGQIEQLTAQMNLDRDIDVLPKEYAELDESNEDFVPELTESIIEEYQSKAFQNGRVDPSVRLADIAKRQVGAVRAAAKKSEAKMKNRVASTADTAAIKPTKPTKETKPISEMSSAEIEEMMKSQGKYIKA